MARPEIRVPPRPGNPDPPSETFRVLTKDAILIVDKYELKIIKLEVAELERKERLRIAMHPHQPGFYSSKHRYYNSQEHLRKAELAMRGPICRCDTLIPQNEFEARKLIWC